MTNNTRRFWSIVALLVIVFGIAYLLRFDPYGWQEKPEVQQVAGEEVIIDETGSNDDGAEAEAETVAEETSAGGVDDKVSSQPETADAASQGSAPTFSILRVEPDGSTVVAGSATPGVVLEVFSGDTVLAETEVGPSGDFVTVFDEPLPPGDHEIGLRSRGDADMVLLSEEIATVSVPEEDSRELMVMVTKPGEPSRLLAQPEAVADAGSDASSHSDGATDKIAASSDVAEQETVAADTSTKPADEAAATTEPGSTDQDGETAAVAEEKTVTAVDKELVDSAEEDTSGGENVQVATSPEAVNEPDANSENAMTSADATSTNQEETTEIASTGGQATTDEVEATSETTGAETDVAQAEPKDAATQDTPVETAMDEKQDDKVEAAAATTPETAAAPKVDASVDSGNTTQGAVAEVDTASTEEATTEPLKTAAAKTNETAPEPEVTAKDAADEDPAEEMADAETAQATEVASLDTGKSERPAVSADVRVRIDAVEIENGQLFVAGSGTPGGRVIVFADKDVVGESMISATGRFLVEAQRELSVGDHTIRADLYLPNGSAAAMRVAVPFNRPEGEMVAAVAPQPDAEDEPSAGEEDAAVSDVETDEAETMSADSSQEAVVVKAPAASATSETESEPKSIEGMAKTDDKPAETQTGMTSGSDQKTAAVQDSAAPAVKPEQKPAVTDVSTTADPVEEKVAVEAEAKPEAETKTVAATGDGSEPPTVVQPALEQRDSSVIIRRGDTLWQISRRVYGRGVRYTTIYLANTDQIDNPDFIEPGQTFMVPDEPLPNAEQLHRDRVLKR